MIQPMLQMANNARGRSGDQPIPGFQIYADMPRPPLQISAGAEMARRLAEKSLPAIADETRPESRPDGGTSRLSILDSPSLPHAGDNMTQSDAAPGNTMTQCNGAPAPKLHVPPEPKRDAAPSNSIIDKIRAARELQQAARAKACMRYRESCN